MSIGASLLFFNALLALALSAHFRYLNTKLDKLQRDMAKPNSRGGERVIDHHEQGEGEGRKFSSDNHQVASASTPPQDGHTEEHLLEDGTAEVGAHTSMRFRYVT